ncbi:MAG: CvpA family protein [Gammaproteobacteria bacterium]|nr:CvpA family protein [Gammaproteobacteria bacterium]
MVFDVGVILLLLVSTWIGMRTGFLKDLIWTISVLVGLIVGFLWMEDVGRALIKFFDLEMPILGRFVGFFMLFSVIQVIGGFIAAQVNRRVEDSGMSFANTMIGLAWGLIRGLLVVIVVTAFTHPLLQEFGVLEGSTISPYLDPLQKELSPMLKDVFPSTEAVPTTVIQDLKQEI